MKAVIYNAPAGPARAACWLAACTLIAAASVAGEGKKQTWDFEADPPGTIARGFTNEVGQWEVALDGGNHVLYQKAKSDDDTFNVALAAGTSYNDFDLSVKLRAVAGDPRPRRRRGLEGEGREELLRRPLQPAGEQLPRLQGVWTASGASSPAQDPGDEKWHTLP